MEPTSSPHNASRQPAHSPGEWASQPAPFARHESEVHRRLILEAAKDYGFFTTDLHRRVTSWNAGAETIFGYTEADMLGRSGDELYVPEDLAQGVPEQELLKAVTEGRAENERWHVCKDKSRVYGSGVVTPLRDETDTVVGVEKIVRDLTRQKLAEEALLQSEERFRAFVIATSEAVYWMSADWRSMHRLVGKSFLADTAAPSLSWLERYIPPQDQAQVQAAIDEAIRTKQPFELEHRVIRADGSVGWTFSRAIPTLNAQGDIEGWFGAASDITERVQAEKRQAFLLALSDGLRPLTDPVAMQATAVELLGLHLNPDRAYYVDVHEATNELIVAYNWQQPDSPDAHQLRRYPLHDWPMAWLMDGKTWVVPDTSTDPALPDDQRVTYLKHGIGATLVVPLVKEGRLVAALVTNQRAPRQWTPLEISLVEETAERTWAAVERAKAELALQQSEKRFRLAIEAAELGTWEWHLPTNEVFWNEQHFRLFGMEPHLNPIDASLFFDHVHPDDRDRVRSELKAALTTQSIFDTEFCALLDNGAPQRWMSGYGRVVEEADGVPIRISGVMFDIDERRRAEDALRMANQRKDEFLALLAHELRNPLATLNNTLLILQLTGGTNDAMPLPQATALMTREVAHLVRLVDDLLDVGRISRGKIVLTKNRIDFVAVVRDAVEAVASGFRVANRALIVDLPTRPLYLLGDATRLKQVVSNLLSNALKFTHPGGHVWLSLHANGADPARAVAELRVRDDGIGIAVREQERIFQMFVQVDLSLGRTQDGLGLGLTLVRELVGLHGGRVAVHSDGKGQGSEFIVFLPLDSKTNATHERDPK